MKRHVKMLAICWVAEDKNAKQDIQGAAAFIKCQSFSSQWTQL